MSNTVTKALEKAKEAELQTLVNKASTYDYWHTSTNIASLRQCVDEIDRIEEEIVKLKGL